MNAKKIFISLLVLVMGASNLLFLQSSAEAATSAISVVLDGKLLTFPVQPQIINDRTMVPFRHIGEAMGASVGWYEPTREVTLVLNDAYVRLYIDNPVMVHGEVEPNATGDGWNYLTQNTLTLDAAPVISNSYTLVPLRAVEGLGAIVDWKDATRTVSITSPLKPTPAPTPTPTPVPTLDPILLDDTRYFTNITGSKAQEMYDDNEQFILVYYDSDELETAAYLPMIKDTAEKQRFRIYGVDRAIEPSNSKLDFIWDDISERRASLPILFFVNGKADVEYLMQPDKVSSLNAYFNEFIDASFYTPKPTPSYGNGTTGPTPRPTPVPTPDINSYWYEINRQQANDRYNGGDRFVLVYYYTGDTDSDRLLSTIKQASLDAKVSVFGLDAAQYTDSNGYKWWGNTSGNPLLYPIVYFVEGGTVVQRVQPNSSNNLANTLSAFSVGGLTNLP